MITCRIKPYIQPFERLLAIDELRALSNYEPQPIDGDLDSALLFKVSGSTNSDRLRSDLAYWEAVGDGHLVLTAQLRGEATSVIARNGVLLEDLPQAVPDQIPLRVPNKRCLRYGTHGLHEYRGKFFPQIVRAFINLVDLPRDATVADPMCGSGTTLVESLLSGRVAYGLDLNPLSVFVSQVKCQSLFLEPKALVAAYLDLKDNLERSSQSRCNPNYFEQLSERDQDYLEKWFAVSTLHELDKIQAAITSLPSIDVQNFYSLSMSNVLRAVSWQKEDDLRIRKEVISLNPGAVVRRFLDEAFRATKTVVAFLAERDRARLGKYEVAEGDARQTGLSWKTLKGQVDAVITSPPYATALPYLDTDRLSLIYLGLLPRNEHRPLDGLMIGNREITDRGRAAYWDDYESHRSLLPAITRNLIERIDKLNKSTDVGFRRRNLSALLGKYFLDMRAVLEQQKLLLRDGGSMFIVIGNNTTTAGGELVEIQTAEHLAAIAETLGFTLDKNLPMEMLVSRDIFRKNAMPSEQILMLRKA